MIASNDHREEQNVNSSTTRFYFLRQHQNRSNGHYCDLFAFMISLFQRIFYRLITVTILYELELLLQLLLLIHLGESILVKRKKKGNLKWEVKKKREKERKKRRRMK